LLSCIRFKEVLVLQGAPLMGLIFSIGHPTLHKIAVAALFGLANFFLVAHVWTLNDWADIHSDTMDRNKSLDVFTSKGIDPSSMFWFSIALLIASLSLFLFFSSGTLLIAFCIAILGFLYSFPGIYAKGTALLSSVTHVVGGLLYFILGYSLFAPIDTNSILTASFFALIFTAGHGIQEVQDHDADRLAGIRTNAVVFGKWSVFGTAVAGFVFSYVYLFLLALAHIVPARLAPAVLVLCPLHLHWAIQVLRAGLSFDSVRRFRRGYNVLFAVIGLAAISTLFS
jgi:4-hydroxybenzoate polyprenyltransferase